MPSDRTGLVGVWTNAARWPKLAGSGLLDQIEAEFHAPGAAGVRLQVWLVRALLLLLVRARLRADESAEGSGNRLMEYFRQLVEAHYAEHWPVETYAAALKLTESRLNRLSRKLSGQTAFALNKAVVKHETGFRIWAKFPVDRGRHPVQIVASVPPELSLALRMPGPVHESQASSGKLRGA
jgi:hypothetical protein